MLALRATESVLRKYTGDEAAYWLHLDGTPATFHRDPLQTEESTYSGVAWSPKSRQSFELRMHIKGCVWHGKFALRGVNVFNDSDLTQPPTGYCFTYEGVEGLRDFPVHNLEYPDGALP